MVGYANDRTSAMSIVEPAVPETVTVVAVTVSGRSAQSLARTHA
jgi:hypothetical protein